MAETLTKIGILTERCGTQETHEFALTRWWSEGDSNRRSSFGPLPSETDRIPAVVGPEFSSGSSEKQFSDRPQRSDPSEASSSS